MLTRERPESATRGVVMAFRPRQKARWPHSLRWARTIGGESLHRGDRLGRPRGYFRRIRHRVFASSGPVPRAIYVGAVRAVIGLTTAFVTNSACEGRIDPAVQSRWADDR